MDYIVPGVSLVVIKPTPRLVQFTTALSTGSAPFYLIQNLPDTIPQGRNQGKLRCSKAYICCSDGIEISFVASLYNFIEYKAGYRPICRASTDRLTIASVAAACRHSSLAQPFALWTWWPAVLATWLPAASPADLMARCCCGLVQPFVQL